MFSTVHPRLRGELRKHRLNSKKSVGSSPLTRGTPALSKQSPEYGRFIPAYAGNSNFALTSSSSESVHPRLRGELDIKDIPTYVSSGSSPLTRGTRCLRKLLRTLQPVHPRLRGELLPFNVNAPKLGGSSPLTRGTQENRNACPKSSRFIPAYAGNS